MVDDIIGRGVDDHGTGRAGRRVDKAEELPLGLQEFPGLTGREAFQLFNEFFGRAACHVHKVRHLLIVHGVLAAVQFGDDLVYLVQDVAGLVHDFEAVEELVEAGGRVGHHGLHGADAGKRAVDAHSVVHFKVRLLDGGAEARCAAQHLLEKYARFHAAHEDKAAYFRHVDASGEQVHGNGNAGEGLILEAADGLVDALAVANTAGDLHDGVFIHKIPGIDFLQYFHDHVGVFVVHGVDERFAAGCVFGVDVAGDLFKDCAVEVLVDNSPVEVLDLEIKLVVQEFGIVYLAGDGIEGDDLVAAFVVDAAVAELGAELVRGVVVHKVAVDDSFAVHVGEHGRAEDFCGLECGRSREGNLDRVEVFDDFAVLALVVALVAVELFCVGHFLVEYVSAVGFVHDNEIVVGDRGACVAVFAVEDAFHHALNRGDVDAGFFVDAFVFEVLHAVDIGERHEFFELYVGESVEGLIAESGAVYKEEDAAEAARLQEAVHHTKNGARLARACGHGEEHAILSGNDGFFGGVDGAELVFTQVEAVFVREEVAREFGKAAVAADDVAGQQFFHAGGAHPAVQGLRSVGLFAQVLEPDAGLFFPLLDVGPAVGRKDEGDAVASPLVDDVGLVFGADV